jgi:general secretion pathway protein A
MYLDHYNLNLKPFEMSPDPLFLWLGEKHKEALAALEYGILESKGFLLLTGDAGTGKTVLINALIKSTRVKAIIATIPDPDLEILDFFNFLSAEFQMNRKFETKGAFLIQFKHFLHEVYESEGKVLLIVDEIQRLNHELLEQIRILSNIELNNRKLINIFFVGQSEFNQVLREERNVAVRKRIAVNYNLDPLDHRETGKYINHRLNVAGATQNLFTPEAIRDIFYFSGGYPRLINIVCDHALLTGYSKELKMIDDSVIAECRKDLQILSDSNKFQEEDFSFEENQEIYEFSEPPAKEQGGKRIWMYVSFALAFILIGYLIFNFGWKNSSNIETKESPPSLKNSLSENESLKSEDAIKGDFDNQKVSKNDQTRTAAVQEKLDETSKE